MTITAKIITDSINSSGNRITTFELEYPRFILAEVNTHRALSRNSSSSRAIPVKATHEMIKKSPAMPIYWGANEPGMVARQSLDENKIVMSKIVWEEAARVAVYFSEKLAEIGNHKQIANRVTEPFQVTKSVVTATEWDNFLRLRTHEDAQPEFKELALKIKQCLDNSSPKYINDFHWHLPYVECAVDRYGVQRYFSNNEEISLIDARTISVSCCAQVSYRKLDDSLERARLIFSKLNLDTPDPNKTPPHSSPAEHQAFALPVKEKLRNTYINPPLGVTHIDRLGNYCSGNFKGWIQYRHLLEQISNQTSDRTL